MHRREFIAFLAYLGHAGPVVASSQEGTQVRRVAFLMGSAEAAFDQANVDAFVGRLDQLGWHIGRNLDLDLRWWTGTPNEMRGTIANMLTSKPDVFAVFTNLALETLVSMVANIPVVFVGVGDPVGSGFVESLGHPGANITGFASYDGPMGGKWLEILKETAPQLTRITAIKYPGTAVHQAFWEGMLAAAPHFQVEIMRGDVGDAADATRVISSLSQSRNAGLVVFPHEVTQTNRDLIIALAFKYRLPAIYGTAGSVASGGLVSYTIDFEDNFRHVAEYVDFILRGKKPSDLPVQEPTKFRLAFNLKTARAIGLEIPPIMFTRADEVIE
jgi:putative ABC transport system substrate-binding protein